MNMNKVLVTIVLALCAPLIGGAAETPKIITEVDLPPGGVKMTYLSEFLVANITSYGVGWYADDKLAVHIYWTDSGEAYIDNLSTYSAAWVKARVDEDGLFVPNGQTVLVSDHGTVYTLVTGIVDMKNNAIKAVDGIRFKVSADRSELEMEPSPDNNNVLGFYTMDIAGGTINQAFSKIKLKEFTLEPVLPPADADYKRFKYSTLLGGFQNWENGCWIAFDDQDVYIQGLEWNHAQAWVKGSLMNDGSIRIPTGQYVGMNGNYPDFYFAAEYEGSFDEDNVVAKDRSAFFLNYNKETGAYTMSEKECFYCGKDRYTGFPVVGGTFTPVDVKAATPAVAEDLQWDSEKGLFLFRIPMTDTENDPIDRYLLSYSVFVNGEKYTFNDSNSPIYSGHTDVLSASESLRFFNVDTEYMFGWNPGNIYAVMVKSDEPIKSLGVELYYDVLGDRRRSERAEMADSPQ